MFGQDRTTMRRFFIETWRKHQTGESLEPLQQVIAGIIQQHPEYHRLLEQPELILEREFLPEEGISNPFLHMGMHIGLQEQVSTDRPPGISALYRDLLHKSGDPHETEHRMMECLGRTLWEAQRSNSTPDEESYLECLRGLLR